MPWTPGSAATAIIDTNVDSIEESIGSSITGTSVAAGDGDATDFIFNAGTRISASVWSPGAGRTVDVWIEIQEI